MFWRYDTSPPKNETNGLSSVLGTDNLIVHSHLSPVLFVIDFDQTLAVFDSDYEFDDGKLQSFYTRPFLYQFLDYLKSVNKNNVLVLWTAGSDFYIKHALLLLNIAQYFDHVMSREHCDKSREVFGLKKCHKYFLSLFPQYSKMRSIIIDNYAWTNSARSGFTCLISVKPFNISDVAKIYKTNIVDDSTLLNVILFLQKSIFKEYSKNKTKTPQIYVKDCYSFSENSAGVISLSKKMLDGREVGFPVMYFFQ